MAIQTECPHCRNSYSLADGLIGKTVRCKNCQEPFVVRDRTERKPPSRSRDEDEDRDEPRAPRRKQKGMPAWLLVVGGVGAFVLMLGCLGCGGSLLWIYGPFANKVTQENFNKIQNGMSEAEVKAILGEPHDRQVPANGRSVLSWKNGNNAIAVTIHNGKVAGKSGAFIKTKRR
jgi:predicted Zn finger-like uncharacterized protein